MPIRITDLSRKQCSDTIRDNVDFFTLPSGGERYTGWCKCGFFCVVYHNGKEMRRLYPIANRICGYISRRGKKTSVVYSNFYGYTDLSSLLKIYLLTLIIVLYAKGESGMTAGTCALLSALYCALVSLFTYLVSRISKTGNENRNALESFVLSVLEIYPDQE